MTRVLMRKKKEIECREEKRWEEKREGDEKIEEERIRKTKIEGKWGIEEEK